ncbi:beta strand repeat-containing protein, partial [[Muricauda] lutisoli]
MKKSILVLIFLLFSGIAFSQTTVTLQDQCNCEVLKGTDVSSAGSVTPAGADLGDIYVNTTTGTIYFWDGDSWELTSNDDQQLTGFTFDDATNILSLSLEDGGSVNVDLSSLKDVLTDSNTTVTSFDIDGTNTNLVITDSDANSYAVALADLAALIDTNTDSQDLTGATLNGSNQLQIDIQNGASTTADLSSLDDSAGVTANASDIATNTSDIAANTGNISTNTTNISTNASDIATNTADIATNTTDIATNASDIGTNATNIATNTSDIAANTADIATNTADIATNTSDIGTNATNIATNTTNISTNATDIAANTADIATNTADIATNTSDIATNASNITTNATNISTNATDISNHITADGDLSSTNEIQNLGEVLTDGNDGGGLAITNIADPTAAQDAATKAYVDSVSDDDITGASLDAPSNVLTISEGTTDVTVDLSDLDDSAGVAANASDIATNTSNIATNTGNISTNTTNIATNASDIATNASDIGTNATNIAANTSDIAANTADIATNTADIATNTTNISTNATNISTNATDIANHVAADGDLSSTNEIQNLGEVLTDGNDGGGLAITNIADPTAAQDAATKAYVDSVSDDDITGASLDAPSNVLTISEGTTDVTVDLSDLDDSAGVAANASDIATNATDIANHVAADGDLSSTNEIQNLGEVLTDGNDGGGLAITNIADPTAAQDAATKA